MYSSRRKSKRSYRKRVASRKNKTRSKRKNLKFKKMRGGGLTLEAIQRILIEQERFELAKYVKNIDELDKSPVIRIFKDVNEGTDTYESKLTAAITLLNKKMVHNREVAERIAAVSQQQPVSVSEQPPQYYPSSASSASSSSPPPAPRSVPQTSTRIVVNVNGSKVDNPKGPGSDTHNITYLVSGHSHSGPKWGIVKELTGISGVGIIPDTYFVITNDDENLEDADTLYEKVDNGRFKVAGSFDRTNGTIDIVK